MTPQTAKTNRPAKIVRSAESNSKRPLKVALVEDQPKVRESWMKLINSFPDFICTCACATGEEAVRTIPQEVPDVVLMDIFLPRMSGIECTVRLKELLPQTQIVILTAMDDQELVFLALEAGADGYLLKRTKPADLRTALVLCEWEERSVAEAAAMLKTTPKAVESRLYRARQTLRQRLAAWL